MKMNLKDVMTSTLVASLVVVLGIVALAVLFATEGPFGVKPNTYAYQIENQVDPEKAFEKFKDASSEIPKSEIGKSVVYVLYKKDCKVCKANEESINIMTNSLKLDESSDIEVSYINADKGLPEWLTKNLDFSFEGVKTPYVIQLRSDLYEGSLLKDEGIRYYPIVHGRLKTEQDIDNAAVHLISGSKVVKSQIKMVTNINHLN